jgi:transcriptional regulator with XRE-family HTH domain
MMPVPSPETLGRTICGLRAKRRLTQESLAELVGSTPQHISQIELGRVNLKVATLSAVAVALGMTASRVLAEAEAAEQRLPPLLERGGRCA